MMRRPRVIPCLLLKGRGLVKTAKFKNPVYLGDPINIVKIFNEKEVDELVLLDIQATATQQPIQFDLIKEIVSEAFVPIAYGGGIRQIEDVKRILALGVEKVCLNSYAVENPSFVRVAADLCGSSSVVASIDVKKSWLGKYEVVINGGRKNTGLDPVHFATTMEQYGAGEILLNSVDNDGSMQGYNLELVRRVARAVSIPVVACGGAGSISDLASAIDADASAAAAGSLFVFHGKHRAVLIKYPTDAELRKLFGV